MQSIDKAAPSKHTDKWFKVKSMAICDDVKFTLLQKEELDEANHEKDRLPDVRLKRKRVTNQQTLTKPDTFWYAERVRWRK